MRKSFFFFFHFDWRCLGILLYLLQKTWPQQSHSALSSDCIMYAECSCVCAAESVRHHFGFSFYLRCFAVILSCVVCRLEIMSSLCRMRRCHSFCLSSIAITSPIRMEEPSKKIRNGRHFFLHPHQVAMSCYCRSLCPSRNSLSGAAFNDNDNDDSISVIGSSDDASRLHKKMKFSSSRDLKCFLSFSQGKYYFSFKFYFERNGTIHKSANERARKDEQKKNGEASGKISRKWLFDECL